MNRYAKITHLSYAFPEDSLDNQMIETKYPAWTDQKIRDKIGISSRFIARDDQTAADLACQAAENLLASAPEIKREEIDLIILCTQSPDYLLPTTACVLQDRLGLPTTCAAFDVNLGCSGYIYGLSIAKGLMETGVATKTLFLTGETYSKWLAEDDLSVRTIFGDAGTATFLQLGDSPSIGPFVLGTDGSGASHLVVHAHDIRPHEKDPLFAQLPKNRDPNSLFMDGAEIFQFTLETVPSACAKLLEKAELDTNDIDLFVFHQANLYMLEQLKKYCKIPDTKFVIDMENYGNTVSCTIPIALSNLQKRVQLHKGMTVALIGFGVGLSWGACIINWQ